LAITSIKTELQRAASLGYAVPLYDVFDQLGVDGVFEAVEEKKAPVILGIYSGARVFQQHAQAFVAYIRARAERVCSPVAIMLDHGSSVEQCLFALECGFTDVMYDGSSLTMEENIAHTLRVVEAAHACGAAVEAELGHVGSGSEYDLYGSKGRGFTDPGQVASFTAETGVDFLAIAFGNAHGVYKGEPHIDLERVAEIKKRVSIPLVMHGGTGLEDAMYAEVVRAGISKINLFTAIQNVATQKMVKAAQADNPTMFTISEQIRGAYYEVCSHYFDIFGATDKA
jgi:fructose-bisphosphate aldolase class II